MTPAMILCAGFGTRLRPITDAIPKPLLPVGDRPAFLHVVDRIRGAGFGPIAMNTHHRAEAFQGRVPADVSLVHEEGRILGTAGGVANAGAWLGEGDVLIWNGDVLAEPDLAALVDAHRVFVGHGAVATLLAVRRERGQGTVGVGEAGQVVRLRGELFGEELSGGDFLGIQLLTERGRGLLPAEGCLVGDVYLPALRRGEQVGVAWHDGEWDDIGNPSALLAANQRWLRRHGLAAWTDPSARIGAGASVESSVICGGAEVRGVGAVVGCLVLPGATVTAPALQLIALQGSAPITAPTAARDRAR